MLHESLTVAPDRRRRYVGLTGVHITLFTPDADAARAFFRDVLELPHTDAGGGWLIFKLPEAELGAHPMDTEGFAAPGARPGEPFLGLSFACDDIDATVARLKTRGVEFTSDITDQGYGRVARFRVPGFMEAEVYQPSYRKPG
jgi:catechol 2,3-dioxygenase-like lactoylglutathione lyase family enzyme